VSTILEPQPVFPPLAALIEEVEIQRAKAYGRAAKSVSTRREYARDWADFERYCRSRNLSALPAEPQTVARYAATVAGTLKIASIRRRMVAISQVHQERDLPAPTAHKVVREVLAGIGNTHGSAVRQKEALTLDLLRAALLTLGRDRNALKASRDRALLLLGFAGAFRRSELAALDVADLRFDRRGLTVTLRRSKTDQLGAGREVAIPIVNVETMCAVRATREWLDAGKVAEGAVFRTFSMPRRRGETSQLQAQRIDPKDVARLVQRVMRNAHLEGDFAAHSLRAGFVTSAAQKKVPEVDIQRVTGHRSVAILRRYVRRATLFENTPLTTILER
jgi:integrase